LWVCFAGVTLIAVWVRLLKSGARDTGIAALATLGLAATVGLWAPAGWFVFGGCILLIQWHPLWHTVLRDGRPDRLAWLIVVAVLAFGVMTARDRAESFGDWKAAFYVVGGADEDLRIIADWARTNTAVDAVFLTHLDPDPAWDQFRGLAQRSIFTNFEEGGGMNWAPMFVSEWAARLRSVGYDVTKEEQAGSRKRLLNLFHNLKDTDVTRVKTQYRLDYWVVSNDYQSHFPVVFRTDDHNVLDVRRAE
jgi:hypothetical protein